MSVLHEHMEATKKGPLMSWATVIYELIRSEKSRKTTHGMGAIVNKRFKEKTAVIILPFKFVPQFKFISI